MGTGAGFDGLPDKVVAFDLETTGLEPGEHRIVEFAFLVLDHDLDELDRWHQLVDPGGPIPRESSEIHGITDEDVAGCPTFEQLGPVIQATIDDAVLMAYNYEFDRSFLHAELERVGGYGIPDGTPFVDPMLLFKSHHPDSPNKLEVAVGHYLGKGLEGAHRAIHDTEAMVEVFRAMQRVHPDLDGTIEAALVEERDWVDSGRKLYRDETGQVRYGFGKHEGKPVDRHPEYAEWMLDADFDQDTKLHLRSVLDG